jgi:glycosyltransferase involved in cell wall biosynthesis
MPASPSSVSHYSLLETIDGIPALQWLLCWIRKRELKLDLCVVCDSRVAATVREITNYIPGVGMVVCDLPSQIDALLEAGAEDQVEECVLLPPAVAFAPPDLISKVLNHHCSFQNDYTFVAGLPDGFTPEIYGPRALQMLRRFPSISDRYSRARTGLEAIVAVVAAKTIQGESLSSTPFAASAWFPTSMLDGLPEPVDQSGFGFARIANRALAVLAMKDGSADVLSGLRAWKQSMLEAIAARKSCLKSFSFCCVAAKQDETTRVLYLQTAGGYSGAEEALYTMIQNLDRSKFAPHVVIGSPGYMAQKLQQGNVEVEVANTDFTTVDDQSVAVLLNAIHRIRPHLIHANGIGEQTAGLVANLADIPLIEHVRVNIPNIDNARISPNWYRRHALHYADKLVAVSQSVKSRLLTCGVATPDIEVVYDGIDIESFKNCRQMRRHSRSALHLPDSAFIMLLVARLHNSKRHDLAIKALAGIHKKIPNGYLVIVGEPISRAEALWKSQLLSLAQQMGFEDRIVFAGFHKDIRPVLGAADVLVLCSDEEPLGICVLEAMAARIPTITTEKCGVAELLENGENSLVVPSNNEHALAQAFEEVSSAPPERLDRLCRNGYETVVTRASARKCAQQVESIYFKLLRRAVGRPPSQQTNRLEFQVC